MKIKSIEELRKIKSVYSNQIKLRTQEDSDEEGIEILVGMATCGISSGARETLNQFYEVLKEEQVMNAKVISVGCVGYCHAEPTVQVNIAGQKPVLYGNVTKDQVQEIVKLHLKEGKPVERLVLKMDFERA